MTTKLPPGKHAPPGEFGIDPRLGAASMKGPSSLQGGLLSSSQPQILKRWDIPPFQELGLQSPPRTPVDNQISLYF